jgi:hypothetical protein
MLCTCMNKKIVTESGLHLLHIRYIYIYIYIYDSNHIQWSRFCGFPQKGQRNFWTVFEVAHAFHVLLNSQFLKTVTPC